MSAFTAEAARKDVVLIVGDDRATSDSLAEVLMGNGLRAVVAQDAEDAKTILQQQRPDAAIVDFQLEVKTGDPVSMHLKEQDALLAVLLLTTVASLEQALPEARQLDGLLVKPLIPPVFVESVRKALTARRLAEENKQLSDGSAQTRPTASSAAAPVLLAPATTEAPNMEEFSSRLEAAMVSNQQGGNPLAVVLVELEGLSQVAEESGEAVRDELTRAARARLGASRRKSDFVARVSENRFAVACADVESPSDFRRVVKIILDEIEAPLQVGETDHWLSPVAGAALTDPNAPGQNAAMVLDDAEVALICARNDGRSWRLFEKTMRDQVLSREDLGAKVREAIDNDELELAYQPVTALQSGRVVGASVHLVWDHDDAPAVLSNEYLAQEGDVALSAQVNAWALDRAFSDLASWRESRSVDDDFRMALRVSERDVSDPQFIETVEELMEKHGIAPSTFSIDLSGPAARAAASRDSTLGALTERGISLSLDDFGMAETSLSWLRDLPLSWLKIDPSLVGSLDSPEDVRGTALVRALISLGHELHLSIVAKGVESDMQKAALFAMGCELIEESTFGRPSADGGPWKVIETARPASADTGTGAGAKPLEILNRDDVADSSHT